MQDELARHECDIIGGGDVPLCGKARAVDKVRVVHAELLRPLVHARDERFLAACEVLAERNGRVVAGDDAHGLDMSMNARIMNRPLVVEEERINFDENKDKRELSDESKD